MRELHPGILHIRPVLRTEAEQSPRPENREGRKIDELFREFYRSRMNADIREDLMTAFLEILNKKEEEEDGEPEKDKEPNDGRARV